MFSFKVIAVFSVCGVWGGERRPPPFHCQAHPAKPCVGACVALRKSQSISIQIHFNVALHLLFIFFTILRQNFLIKAEPPPQCWGINGPDMTMKHQIHPAPNMIASTRQLQMQHSFCIAHSLNSLVLKSCDQIPTLPSTRHKDWHIVTYFRSSTTAKKKLAQLQQQMGQPTLRRINEAPTHWSSTYEMLSRLHDERDPVWYICGISEKRLDSTYSW